MLSLIKTLVWCACFLEFIFAFYTLKAMGDAINLFPIISLAAFVMLAHCLCCIILTQSLTLNNKIIFLFISGILLLGANLIEGLYINPIPGALYIAAGIIATIYDRKKNITQS
ncbi:hypothetical protein QJV03_02370 [Listeria swaminathanii]|uniref:Uncharacterized protein n=1 Tax=Listeria swaminathanii TaxID=2713501 RepID=A0ABU2IEP2_9LIST|nr:hypothetical protein [Listeria swaminathanii]MCD2246702.1 hypothetical protein [Listeria marthii]MDT0016030.1 hypothetical protein [Listeria swaminathanii]MDT0021466.1 hypothetical protein [Listeria swaminathanii]MDT0032430.1 hypothetical protein [Listeria swaminathanii]MDT0051720.1 hypothetical protein [Listeria swaminathanii]